MASKRETWKSIPGFSWYEVSSKGRLRSYKPKNQNAEPPKKPSLMRIRVGHGGYLRVTLQDDFGQKRVMPVHLLVARAFLGAPKDRIVRHLDGDRSNAALDNLAYGSREENEEDKIEHGTHGFGEQNVMSLLTEDEVLEIYDLKGEVSQTQLAKEYGISRQAVSDIHRGITWADVTDAE